MLSLPASAETLESHGLEILIWGRVCLLGHVSFRVVMCGLPVRMTEAILEW
jgi:hypothetical protein